ncbi:hypothetical protein [Sphingomonas sp. DC1100-1]|uniref:hypothetical protein n=1 Tax=unclassified Sphingomonas TaxID=196159 RepID=UPI003CF2500B
MLRIIATIMNAMTMATVVAVLIYECGALSRLLSGKITRLRTKGIRDGNSRLNQ